MLNKFTDETACPSSSSFERVVAVHCLAALDVGAGVEQPFDCLNKQKQQKLEITNKNTGKIPCQFGEPG